MARVSGLRWPSGGGGSNAKLVGHDAKLAGTVGVGGEVDAPVAMGGEGTDVVLLTWGEG